MSALSEKWQRFLDEMQEWAGNDPVKATIFGVLCALGGAAVHAIFF